MVTIDNKLDMFNDERILNGEVSDEEMSSLRKTVVRLYLERAKREGKTVEMITDQKEYDRLWNSNALFDGDKFYMLLDEGGKNLIDMTPLAYRLMDTVEGNFYAKCMLYRRKKGT